MATGSKLSLDAARNLARRVFLASGVKDDIATRVADALVAAEADGQKGHGLSRVVSYAAQARSGKVDGRAMPIVTRPAPGIVAIDAAGGFAYPAVDLAIAALPEVARMQGIALAGIRNSHHAGQLCAHVEALAEAGLVAIMVANTPKAMAPWGGAQAVFGTNPIAFACPAPDGPPMVIDMSLSEVARGKIVAASKTGDAIPEGWAKDAEGRDTTDPVAALQGTMSPAGGAKGAVLALMVEILCAPLIGANLSADASSFFEAEGETPGVGQTIIVIDPNALGTPGFLERIGTLFQIILSEDGTRIPGQSRIARRAAADADGLTVAPAILAEIEGLV